VLVGARAVDRHGFGSGWTAVALATSLPTVRTWLANASRQIEEERAMLPVAIVLVIATVVTALKAARPPWLLRGGVFPALVANWAVGWVLWGWVGSYEPLSPAPLWMGLAVVVAGSVVCSAWFQPFDSRGLPAGIAVTCLASLLCGSAWHALASRWIGALAPPVLSLALSVALVADVVDEARARWTTPGDLVPVWPLHAVWRHRLACISAGTPERVDPDARTARLGPIRFRWNPRVRVPDALGTHPDSVSFTVA
jgi:hypothetical protein